MAEYLKIAGVSGNSFSLGLKTNKATFATNGTNVSIDKILDMDTHKIINLVDPVANQDAMTLKYADDNYINLTEKGVTVATLVNGKVPISQLPSAIMEYMGAWDAATNFPVLADAGTATKASKEIQDLTYEADVAGSDGNSITIAYTTGGTAGSEVVTVVGNAISVQIEHNVSTATQVKAAVDNSVPAAALVAVTITGTAGDAQTAPVSATNLVGGQDTADNGDVYRVSVGGTQNLGSGNITFYVGDFAIYNGSKWERSPGTDITGKMDLVATPTNGNVLTTDATGQAIDSGIAGTDLVVTNDLDAYMLLAATPTNGNVLTTDATGQATDSGTALSALTGKMELVATPTDGNLVTTDATGQATDSGIAADDIMLLAATPTDGNILTTNATGQATDSGVAVDDVMLLVSTPTDGNVVTTDATGQATDSGTALSDLALSSDLTGMTKTIEIPLLLISKTSTYSLPNGARVKNVSLVIETPYTAAATIAAAVGAVSILGTGDNDAQTAGQYSISDVIKIATGAVISITVGNAPIAGAATLYVDVVETTVV